MSEGDTMKKSIDQKWICPKRKWNNGNLGFIIWKSLSKFTEHLLCGEKYDMLYRKHRNEK